MKDKYLTESCKPSPNAKVGYCIFYDSKDCPKTCHYAQKIQGKMLERDLIRENLNKLLSEDMKDF